MKNINILLTSVGGHLTEPLVSNFYKYSLKENIKIKIFGIDNKDNLDIKNYIEYFEKSPLGSEKNYSSYIEKFCLRYQINIIIPRSDEEAIKISRLKKNGKLKKIEIFVSKYKHLLDINNKISTYRYLDNTVFKFDNWYVCNNRKSLLINLKKFLSYTQTCVIKPADSRGGRGILFISKTPKQNEKYISYKKFKQSSIKAISNYPIIIMEELKKKIIDIDVFCDQGNLINMLVRERIFPMHPNAGNIILNPNKFYSAIKDLVRTFNLDGIHDFDVMYDNKNNLKVIEINPRMSGSFAIATEADDVFIVNIFRKYLNKPFKKSNIRKFNFKLVPKINLIKN